ncbi:MAG: type IV toxin-antitoxin system AbiEi family antitoxin domain-containing protein [Patulibacter sp.]|nr:type IV toxin-antitoxin system AbiEi family antitoxin domain-containing protein [Patulibacter sp.]
MSHKTRKLLLAMLRSDALDALLEVASEQGGYVSSAQASAMGLARHDVARLVRSGDVHRVRRGVLRMRHADRRHEDEVAAWLHFERGRLPWDRQGHSEAVLSHDSAAALHGLGSIIPTHPSVTVSPKRRRATDLPGVDVHGLPLHDVDWSWLEVDGLELPVTTPARTIVDLLLAGHEPSYVRRAIAEATHDGRMTTHDLREAAARRRQRSQRLQTAINDLVVAA